jgi:iron complex transport system ATP-binding protein
MRLEGRGIRVAYGRRFALEANELLIAERAVTGLIGPNGAGKSTLLRVLSRTLKPERGVVLLDGQELHKLPSRRVARKLAFVGHDADGQLDLTVLDLVRRGRFPHQSLFGGDVQEDRRAVAWAVDVMRLTDLLNRPLTSLSHGELRRAWTAVALAQRPDVLLLDEPTAFLDITHQLELLSLLSRLTQHGVTVLMSMHDLTLTAQYCDEVIALRAGVIAAHGPTEEILTPDLVREVFRVDSEYRRDPGGGRRILVPYVAPAALHTDGARHAEAQATLAGNEAERSPH